MIKRKTLQRSICKNCGKEFRHSKYATKQTYCSRRCVGLTRVKPDSPLYATNRNRMKNRANGSINFKKQLWCELFTRINNHLILLDEIKANPHNRGGIERITAVDNRVKKQLIKRLSRSLGLSKKELTRMVGIW